MMTIIVHFHLLHSIALHSGRRSHWWSTPAKVDIIAWRLNKALGRSSAQHCIEIPHIHLDIRELQLHFNPKALVAIVVGVSWDRIRRIIISPHD